MLPTPGTAGFTPALVAAISNEPALRGWDPDAGLVAVVLLALTVKCGGVIVDVATHRSQAPATNIARAARVASALTESVFGLETRVLHLGSSSYTSEVKLEPSTEALVITGLEEAPPAVLVKLRSEAARERSRQPLLVWVRDEDRDGAPMWLLDLFACSTPLDMKDVDLPPMGLSRTALVPPQYIADLHDLLILTHIHPPLELHIANLIAAACLHPQLEANISQSGNTAVTQLVKAHRLLSEPFPLPHSWQTSLETWRRTNDPSGSDKRVGRAARADTSFIGGPGGVATWAVRAGEVPRADKMLGYGAQDWYCTPDNVAGAWELAIRHRIRVREPGDAALYALNATAQDRAEHARKHQTVQAAKDAARKRRMVLDEALDGMLLSV